jgi:Transposase DDE domain group 1
MSVAKQSFDQEPEGLVVANATRLVRSLSVTDRGQGLVSHAGLVWLGRVADATGLTSGFNTAMAALSRRRHDPGRTLLQLVLTLADGGMCVSDLAGLRGTGRLFGPVASVPTAWRSFNRIGPAELRGLDRAVSAAREVAWRATGEEPAGFVIDLDATLVTTKADKQDAAPTWKRTYGHHPLLAMDAARGEVLAVMLRPGNAGSNTAADHVVVLGQALDALPARERAGHQPGDDPGLVRAEGLVRADAGGASHWLVEECGDRNLQFSVGYWIDGRVRDALLLAQEEDWTPAIGAGGGPRPGAFVQELTGLVALAGWPIGTRLIVRRERPHPGAQLSLFDDHEGWRHTAFITDQPGEPAALELRQRQRARAENVIRDVKACGLANLPSDCVVNNDIWARLAAAALNLLAWARRLTLNGRLAAATPKTLRYKLLHTAGRLTNGRLDLDHNWPGTTILTQALDRLAALLPPPTVTKHRNPQPTS